MEKRGKGLRPLPPDERDYSLGALFPQTINVEELPRGRFLVATPLEVKDQKATDFCAAFSSTSVSEDQEGVLLAPEYTYAKMKELCGRPLEEYGSNLRDICKVHQKIGAIEKKDSPFSVDDHDRDFLANPGSWPKGLDQKAAIHKKGAYLEVHGKYDLFDDIRVALWQFREEHRTIITGVLWRDEWTDAPRGILSENYQPGGEGHAIKIVGFDYLTANTPVLIIQNSWGTGVGDNGLYYMTRNIVNRELTFGNYMFKDLPPEETHDTAIDKSQQYRDSKKKSSHKGHRVLKRVSWDAIRSALLWTVT